MTGPRELVDNEYSFRTFDETIGKSICFREVALDRDLGRLHTWLNSEHVLPYWNQDDPLPQVRDTIAERAANDDQTLYIGSLDHVPMSYWESYWPVADGLGEYYDAEPTDRGFHILIGPTEYLGKGYAVPLMTAMTTFLFQHPETRRVVVEPDSRNDAVIHALEQCGFEPQDEIEFPDKTGQLMFCWRDTFEEQIA